MIPVRLAIQGLYSYQERQEVDFQQLVNTSLFGIFGRVGSGKTSLLEAISFVLYGETERLNGRDNRQYNMMNLKSNHMVIDFEFKAGVDQHLYKYIYEAKRNAKKHHEIKAGERRVFRKIADEWVPESIEREDIASFTRKLIGLDYDNFKRTIIIPQNQFREFLELSPKDRTEMMSRLFQLDKFDLSSQVSRLEKSNTSELDFIKGQLDGLGQATPEAIEEAKAQIQQVETVIEGLAKDINQLTGEEKQLAELQNRHAELHKVRQELANYLAHESDYNKIRDRITQYEQCQFLFKSLFDQLAGLTEKHDRIATDSQRATLALKEANSLLPGFKEAYKTAKTAYEQRHVLQEKMHELDTVLEINTNQNTVVKLQQKLGLLNNELGVQRKDIATKQHERQGFQLIINKMTGLESKLDRLNDIRNWFSTYKPLKKAVSDFDIRLTENEAAQQNIKHRKDRALQGFPAEWGELPLKILPDTIQDAITLLKQQRHERKQALDDLLLKQHLQRYANALTDGKPCPLCGSEHHPAKHQNNTIDEEVEKGDTALQKWETRIDQTIRLQSDVNGLLGELKTVFGQTKTLINDRTKAVAQLTEHEDLFIWPEFTVDQEKDVLTAIDREKAQQKQFGDAQRKVNDLNQQIEQAERKRSEQEQIRVQFDSQITSLQETIQQQVSKLQHYQSADITQFSPSRIKDQKDVLNKQYEQTKVAFERATETLQKGERNKATLEGSTVELIKQQTQLLTEQESVNDTLAETLIANNYTRLDVEQVLKTKLDTVRERGRVESFYKALDTTRHKVDELVIELATKPFDPARLTALHDRLRSLREDNNVLQQDLGQKQKNHSELIQQWQQKQDVQKQYNTLSLRQKDLKELDSLFRGQGFVKYVSTVYLNDLCQTANERFMRLTKNQLRLEFDDGNFMIRDFLNGGKTRLAKTLSGGQMFQAALSLALALSDNIQHLTQSRQNLFFLDEGFGSLDKNALQVVFETLKLLRKENRIVGIISHVDELQQEIDTYIRTVETENGSQIQCSWK